MKMSSLLNHDNILIGVEGSDRRSLYLQILKKLSNSLNLDIDAEKIIDAMIEREDTTKIPYDNYLAIPHTRNKNFKDLHFAIAVTKKTIPLKPYDKTPSQIILMSLISESTSGIYLKILSSLVRFVSKEENVKKIIACKTPDEMIYLFEKEKIEVKHALTAEDVVNGNIPRISPNDTVSKAIDIFVREHLECLPVIDEKGRLLGSISVENIIKRAIPEHFFMLENINFLSSFEPFEKFLKDEENIKVSEIMSPPDDLVKPETPLIRMTVFLLKKNKTFFVVADDNTFLGVLRLNDIVEKILRG